jgi:transcriptional regulator with XRE-family HTH domain
VLGVKTPIRQRFGERFKELRLATGMSQEAFADKCGFARSYMSRIERGIANPSLDAVEALADSLGVKVSELFIESPTVSSSRIQVPIAKDGSYFNKSTFRPNTKEYNVGEKGKYNTKSFKSFDEALAYLKSMPTAKWWRPNSKGQWGLVSAVRWVVLPEE